MFTRLCVLALVMLFGLSAVQAQTPGLRDTEELLPQESTKQNMAAHTAMPTFQDLLQDNFKLISRPSVRTVQTVIHKIVNSGFDGAAIFLDQWSRKNVWFRKSDELLVYVRTQDDKTYSLIDIQTGDILAKVDKRDIRQINPNSGVRSLLGLSLVASRINSDDIEIRRASLETIKRDPRPVHLAILRKALTREHNAQLKQKMMQLERLLTVSFEKDTDQRVAAILQFEGALSLDVRAALNPLLSSSIAVADRLPQGQNIARVIDPGVSLVTDDGGARRPSILDWFGEDKTELTIPKAYELLVQANFAPPLIDEAIRNAALLKHVQDGMVAGVKVEDLNTEAARDSAYAQLVTKGLEPPAPTQQNIKDAVDAHVFYATYNEPNNEITQAAKQTLESINFAVSWNRFLDLLLDAVSLASIYFLAAIGLAITFGVMRVINMAHGEFIMMGAYSGFVVQQYVTNYTLSIIIAIPLSFAVTFIAGVAMERLIIRHLYNRPLETLLATFGVSIALQQIAKNIFGTQARPLTAPDWLDGALVINDVVSISWIRIVIFVMGAVFLCFLWFILNKTRLGMETRAVTQNPRMAASMGINTDKVNMLTFGLGSGIAGVAGVAIGLFAKVTSELGSDYIVQSFMTVVVGGVGNIWGTLAGAGLIGIVQKLIESLNPSNTLAAKTYMIIFIIIFIQFRPRGMIALKGRAAEA